MAKALVDPSGYLWEPEGDLTPSERMTREWHEDIIDTSVEQIENSFQEIAKALYVISSQRLYRPHSTMREYIEERFPKIADMGRRYVYYYIGAGEVLTDIEAQVQETTPLPTKEAHTRALSAVPREERGTAWQELRSESRGEVTTKDIEHYVQREYKAPATSAVPAQEKWKKVEDLLWDAHHDCLYLTRVQCAIPSRNLTERRDRFALSGKELRNLGFQTPNVSTKILPLSLEMETEEGEDNPFD